jgi:hypothetical protein
VRVFRRCGTGDGIADLHLVACGHFDGAVAKVGEKNETAHIPDGDHDVVPGDGWRATSDAVALAEQLEPNGQL